MVTIVLMTITGTFAVWLMGVPSLLPRGTWIQWERYVDRVTVGAILYRQSVQDQSSGDSDGMDAGVTEPWVARPIELFVAKVRMARAATRCTFME